MTTAFGKGEAMQAMLTAAHEAIDLDPRTRAKKLSLERFIELHNALYDAGVYNA